jgi:hypothetical protein
MVVPAVVQPLVWLLIFDVVLAVIWWILSMFGFSIPEPRLRQVIVALIIIINVVVVLVWLLGFLGVRFA